MHSHPSATPRANLLRTFACLTALTITTFGCSDDTGTDIEVSGGSSGSAGKAGSGGKSTGGSNGSTAGKGGSTSPEGGDNMGGDASGGEPNGGSMTNGGNGGAAAGSGGQGGTVAGGGAGGTTGGGGAGTAGNGGNAGTAGTAGTAGNGGTAGMAGTAGTAGNGGTAGTAGTGGTGPTSECGDNVVEGNEECEPDSTPLCSDTCEAVGTSECLECELAGDCFEFAYNCEAFSGTNQTLCYDVLQCIQDSNCLDGTGTLGKCFCGTIASNDCGSAPLTGAGSPNGPCKDLMVAGLQPVTTSQQVLGQLTATSKPAGGAGARLKCQKEAKTDSSKEVGDCYNTCGFGSTSPFPP